MTLSPALWSQLAASSAKDTDMVFLRLIPGGSLNVLAALDRRAGKRYLVLTSPDRAVRVKRELPTGRGFSVVFDERPDHPGERYRLHFELSDSTRADVFDVIGNDVLAQLACCTTDREGFDTFVARITEWQDFLGSLPGNGLGTDAQQGLFAELLVLRAMLKAGMEPGVALAAWAGPKRQAKDFQFDTFAIEVKSSSTAEPISFRVSNERQLEADGIGRLFLCGVVLERVTAGAMALPTLVGSLRAEMEGKPLALLQFASKLVQAGYLEGDAERYSTQFLARRVQYFEVGETFPRVLASDLRSGVVDVRYSILLSECARFSVADSVVEAMYVGVHA